MEGRPKRKAAELAFSITQPTLAKKLRTEEEQSLKLTNDAAEALIKLSENPMSFSQSEGVEGDAGKYVKYLKDKLTTKSPAVVFATKAYGPKVVADFIAKRKAVRYMFAPADNTAQCVRAGLTNPPGKDEVCWLCGYGIYNNGKAVDTIACEHILPVIQAVIFADIALPKTPSTSTPELVKAEYGWAHSVCNGPKSSSVFIKEIKDEAGNVVKWETDDSEIARVLTATIPEIRRLNIDNGELIYGKDKWIKRRLESIKQRIQPILNKINYGEDTSRMTILLGVGKLLDPERWASKTPLDELAYAEYADRVIEHAAETSLSQKGKSRKTLRKQKRKYRKTLKNRK